MAGHGHKVMATLSTEMWNEWHQAGEPRYPHEKVVQFCFRNYPSSDRSRVRALDLGCGSGVHTVFLSREGFITTGVDTSPVGLAQARRKLADADLQADLHLESVDALSFRANSFDLVICVGVYDCTGPVIARRSVERVADVLSQGGRGLFLFASNRDFRLSGDEPRLPHGYKESEVKMLFADLFHTVWIDRYITTYENGRIEQNDWLVTVRR
jgi:SAM-dependent methyltransferase